MDGGPLGETTMSLSHTVLSTCYSIVLTASL
jgi:hypothetical protein